MGGAAMSGESWWKTLLRWIKKPGLTMYLGGLVTFVFLALIWLLLKARFPEWWPLESPIPPGAEEPARLTLSEIGNVLAGIFAPLAFLWLFIATILQRQELELQREELRETREVLSQTANANRDQAILMKESLSIAQKSNEYDYFSLLLYYCALSWKKINRKVIARLDKSRNVYQVLGSNNELSPNLENSASVDFVFEMIYRAFVDHGHTHEVRFDQMGEKSLEISYFQLYDFSRQIEGIVHILENSDNTAVMFRGHYLRIKTIYSSVYGLCSTYRETALEQYPELVLPPL
jgi:hypothetical protein